MFHAERVRIGVFRARPHEPHFEDSGPARGHLLVFPRTAVRITHAGQRPVVATPSRVMFYNRGAEYRREAIAPEGDDSMWLSFDAKDLAAALAARDPAAAERPDQPFAWTSAPVSAATVLCQRLLLQSACAGDEAAAIEEQTLTLLDAVLAEAFGRLGRASTSQTLASKTHRARIDLAVEAEATLARHFTDRFSLGELASRLGVSPFHLCRVFRAATGRTLHGYVTDLRLHRGLERILDGEPNLAALAVDLGFATHSHFTQAFRRRFGMSPSKVRARRFGC